MTARQGMLRRGVRWLGLVLAVTQTGLVDAAELRFRRLAINADSTFPAAAAIDVDGDGRLDIASGGWWYRAPNWEPQFLRDVEEIRGRFDDYSNLPLDVNGDGWTDIVSANYRSETIYWIEHPGRADGKWITHAVERPGPSETGRLVDIDGDGRLDVLPNGTKFAAWWEVAPPQQAGDAPRWTRHELPDEIMGHGVGFGDIDSDGRGDLVTANGWAQAPADPRNGRWYWHPEFRMQRDASIPILVFDVDEDGDNDLVWGRGHGTGLYWYEQAEDGAGTRQWTMHAIDTSWSQPHSLLLGDLDNDGQPEVLAGKRFLGHDGKDLGEWDPMIVCAYRFLPATRTFERTVLSMGSGAGFGLDPKIVDLDGDGDLDLLCPDRSGLYLLENLLIDPHPEVDPAPTSLAAPDYADHAQLLALRNETDGPLEPVETPADWGLRRAQILEAMQQVMGPLPDPSRRVPLDVRVVEEADTPAYVRRKITFAVEPGDRCPAWLLLPKSGGSGQAMLCLHQTTKIGKDEPAGLGGRPSLHYAHELASRGFVCLVPDSPSLGEYTYDFAGGGDGYASGSMKAVWNNVRAIDLLESLPEVHPDRIGVIGHSLGGHHALFTAAFDQRVSAVVTSCGFTAFHDYYGGDLRGWTSDRYMPRIRDVYDSDPDRMPFDFHEVLAAIAPRPLFVNAPLRDANFAAVGVDKVTGSAAEVYSFLEARDRLEVVRPDAEHDFPDDVRRRAEDWLAKQLK